MTVSELITLLSTKKPEAIVVINTDEMNVVLDPALVTDAQCSSSGLIAYAGDHAYGRSARLDAVVFDIRTEYALEVL